MTNRLDRMELADLVEQHASAGDSGTLLIRSSNGHSLMIAFDRGSLTSLIYGNHRGPDAMPDILDFINGTYSFTAGLVGRRQENLPAAITLAKMLRDGSVAEGGGSPSGKKDNFANADHLIEQVAALLMEYLGPISAALCENVLDDVGGISSSSDANGFVTQLSLEIDDLEERKLFITKAAGIISQLK